jgi:hypothetical protein
VKQVNEIRNGLGSATAWAVAAIAVSIVLAPAASANTDPDIPYGTTPTTSTAPTHHVDDQDEADTSGGFVDRPF